MIGIDVPGPVIAGLITLLWSLIIRFSFRKSGLSPDERFYMNPKEKPPAPYVYRWLPRLLFVKNHGAWRWASRLSMFLCGPLLYEVLVMWGLEPQQALLGVWLFVGFNGVFGINHLFLGLVDQLGMVFMLASTLAALKGQVVMSAILALIGGSCSERTPVFAAISAMSFWPLIGIISPILARKFIEPGPIPLPNNPKAFWWLKTPVMNVGKKTNGPRIMDWKMMILPWGACAILLPLGCTEASLELLFSAAIALVVGYGQLRIATDTHRLYQWAFVPVLAISVLSVPLWAYPLIIVLHPFLKPDENLF